MQAVGVKVIDFEICEVKYSKEIAQAMLQKQQSESKIEAREFISKGGVDISILAMKMLKEEGIELKKEYLNDLFERLTILMSSDIKKGPSPKNKLRIE